MRRRRRRWAARVTGAGFGLIAAVAVATCGDATGPLGPPVQPSVTIGAVVFTAQARLTDENHLAVRLLAENTSLDTLTVEINGGCPIIARVFSDPARTHLKWRSLPEDVECVLLPLRLFLEPLGTTVTEQAWDYRVWSRRYVTAQFDHGGSYTLDAGMVEPGG